VTHKTERGGVVLDIDDEASLLAHASRLQDAFAGIPHKLLVQRMAPRGTELIVGARRDPVFGPVVLVGAGGILAELIRDTVVELAPVDRGRALAMLGRLKARALLEGFRGAPRLDVEAVSSVIEAVSRLVSERDDIVEVDINPLVVSTSGALAVDALVRLGHEAHVPKKRPRTPEGGMEKFFEPGSIALLGASRSHGKGGNIILRNLVRAGFKGAILPINPSGHDILGMRSYKRLTDVPGPVDLAMIVIPKRAVREALADCAAKNVGAVILCTGGYADAGPEGAAEQKQLVSFARSHGMRLMGPNSIGVINPGKGLATSIVGLEPLKPGGVALVGQSGVFSSGWGRWIAESAPFGVSKVACIG
ncbi:MAG TPA: acetate--CoA ligase family protein, partial [Deltaproteobacteria bacterium]|nr:acetate--CoA ligase family protein [Deltaproteobacteria bacterium]